MMLCESGKSEGFRLLPYQMTRRAIMLAVVEVDPDHCGSGCGA
jgi:hypothetical protein